MSVSVLRDPGVPGIVRFLDGMVERATYSWRQRQGLPERRKPLWTLHAARIEDFRFHDLRHSVAALGVVREPYPRHPWDPRAVSDPWLLADEFPELQEALGLGGPDRRGRSNSDVAMGEERPG